MTLRMRSIALWLSLLSGCSDGSRPASAAPEDVEATPDEGDGAERVDAGRTDARAPTQRDAGASGREPDAAEPFDTTDAETPPAPEDPPEQPSPAFKDPGAAPWELVPDDQVAEKCKLDPALLASADSRIGTAYAVVRYGQLCHQYRGNDSAAEVYSATKTLGAVAFGAAAYQTRDFPRSGDKTGPLSDTDKATFWLGSVSFNQEAYLAHVLAMEAHNRNLDQLSYSYDTVGSVQINRLSDAINTAIAQDSARFGANIDAFTKKFVFEPLGMKNSMWSGGSANKNFAYTWSSTLGDMARIGLLVMHRGMWNGERVLSEDFAYKMTHPSFEAANTAYGYLTWLNARTGGTGPGGAGTGTGGDPCAPAAVWQRYPHGTFSKVTDCHYSAPHTCANQYDVGVWSAQGLGGQFIVGHAGLDMVIVAKNFSGGGGPTGLWTAIRPALVKLDPKYAGDEQAFCTAYGANDYAPDLVGTVTQPAD